MIFKSDKEKEYKFLMENHDFVIEYFDIWMHIDERLIYLSL